MRKVTLLDGNPEKATMLIARSCSEIRIDGEKLPVIYELFSDQEKSNKLSDDSQITLRFENVSLEKANEVIADLANKFGNNCRIGKAAMHYCNNLEQYFLSQEIKDLIETTDIHQEDCLPDIATFNGKKLETLKQLPAHNATSNIYLWGKKKRLNGKAIHEMLRAAGNLFCKIHEDYRAFNYEVSLDPNSFMIESRQIHPGDIILIHATIPEKARAQKHIQTEIIKMVFEKEKNFQKKIGFANLNMC